MKQEKPEYTILSLTNGSEIMIGLNILCAIHAHPTAQTALLRTVALVNREINMPVPEIIDCIKAAVAYVEELNKIAEKGKFIGVRMDSKRKENHEK